jgi:uncharacterized protein YjeT (DUF2065 family)
MEMHVVAFIAIGGTLLFEGLIWAIFPGPTRQMYIGMLDQLDNKSLHLGGLISVILGIVLIGLAVN